MTSSMPLRALPVNQRLASSDVEGDETLESSEDEADLQPSFSKARPKARRRTAQDAALTPQAHRRIRRKLVLENLDAENQSPESARRKKKASAYSVQKSIRTKHAEAGAAVEVAMDRAQELSTANEREKGMTPRPIEAQNRTSPIPQPMPEPFVDITAVAGEKWEAEPTEKYSKTTNNITSSSQPIMPVEKPMDIVIRTRARPAALLQEPEVPKPRLVITYLVLTNFKSYAGRQEVGPFHASFSSVVGPNGSGKSNVIDSLLFVFGFRASKMRQGKISSLIHNSAAHPDLDHCEVQVHFQEVLDHPDGQKEVMPDSSLLISRKAFKNNSSTYQINGSTSNFTEVTTLLRDRGVDLDHKRFLILQGEVESIAQMKPKATSEHDDGLLEYLEDIIGTSKYKIPIEEAVTEMETLNEICMEKSSRVQHVDKERKSLEGKKNEALAYVRNENDLAVKQATLCQIFMFDCQDNIDVTGQAAADAEKLLTEEMYRHRHHMVEIERLGEKLKAQERKAQQLEATVKSAATQSVKADKELVKAEEKMKHHRGKLTKLEKSLSLARGGASDASTTIQDLRTKSQQHHDSIEDLKRRLASEEILLDDVRNDLSGKTQGLSDQITGKQKLLEPTLEEISQKQSAVTVAESELQIIHGREAAGAEEIEALRLRLSEVALQTSSKEKQLSQNELLLESKTREQVAIKEKLRVCRQRQADSQARASSARQKAEEARASLAKSQNQGNVLSSLTRLRDSGRVTGFHGRLGNLGAIDKTYDIAVSTACPALDNLVVDTVEVAQQCIDHLRKNNLGRANFICLDKLGGRDILEVDTPENTPRLFDLIRPKHERFLPAFFSVVQNTLVATDLEQANRVAYGARRWRVVTLDGQLIDKSGTMSGGGTRTARGAMSSQIVEHISKDQLEKLQAVEEKEENVWREMREEEACLDDSVKHLQEAIPNLEMEIRKDRLQLKSMQGTGEDLQRRARELASREKKTVGADKSVRLLQGNIERLNAEIELLKENTRGLDGEIQALQDTIMEVGGVRLRGQRAKVDGLREELDTVAEQLSSADSGISKAEKQLAKHERARSDAETEIRNIQAGMTALEDDQIRKSEEAAGCRREVDQFENEIHSQREDMASAQAELDQQQLEMDKLRSVELEIRNKMEEHQKALADNQKRFRYWQEKLSKLTIQSLSDLAEDLQDSQIPSFTRDELADMDKNVLKGEIAILEERTQMATVELGVLAEYRRRVEEHAARSGDLAEAIASRDSARRRCDELRRLRLEGFMEGFGTISLRLKEMYQMITMGGNAELELVDSLDPFSEGILFSVMPPKKSWKNISNLSGGEKTLSSLALVFALHHYKPTPLYVMDEIDAALDFRNVSIVASYIKERTKNAQFIVISLRNNMVGESREFREKTQLTNTKFELASRLVGVYKVNHMTKSVTVENRDYIARA